MRTALTLVVVLAVLVGGCVHVGPNKPPSPRIACHLAAKDQLRDLRRVVFVELAAEHCPQTVAEDLTRALHKAVQDRKLFHIRLLRRDDQVVKDLRLDTPRRYTMDELKTIRRALDCDAILIGKATSFEPYPRTQVNLYLALVDVRKGVVVWGVDHIWDTTDKDVVRRVKWFTASRLRSQYDQDVSEDIALSSPRAFAKFVAYETSLTLGVPVYGQDRERTRRQDDVVLEAYREPLIDPAPPRRPPRDRALETDPADGEASQRDPLSYEDYLHE